VQLVYGGGSIGLMGEVAKSALANGGKVVGIIPRALVEYSKVMIGETIYVEDMHSRKKMMNFKADAFVALPGGIGTFEELLEMTTWAQLNIHNKPVIALNTFNYYSPLRDLITSSVHFGFLTSSNASLLKFAESVDDVISYLKLYRFDQSAVIPLNWDSQQSRIPPDSGASDVKLPLGSLQSEINLNE
jgi:uncharacterized protein (TIGR00730 family)